MSSKKISKSKRKERRLAEISRAQQSVTGHTTVPEKFESHSNSTSKIITTGSGYHVLPISEIKKDMIKNVVYLIFAIGAIVAIKITGADLAGIFY